MKSTILRWVFAIGLFGLSAHLIRLGSPISIVSGLFLIILGLLVIASDIFKVATAPLHAMVDSIFFPGGKFRKPLVNYKLPEHYIRRERFDEALAEYLFIIHHHPGEVKAYIGALELICAEEHNDEWARKIYEKGRRKLRSQPENLMWLEARWQQLKSEWIIA